MEHFFCKCLSWLQLADVRLGVVVIFCYGREFKGRFVDLHVASQSVNVFSYILARSPSRVL